MVDGLFFTPLKIIKDNKGEVRHGLKKSDSSFSGFGEAYFSSVEKGVIKGWKRHNHMTMNLIVIVGEVQFVCFDDRPDSKTHGTFFESSLSRENYGRLTIPPGVWLSFLGKKDDNILVNIASIEHDPQESDVLPISDLDYDWASICEQE